MSPRGIQSRLTQKPMCPDYHHLRTAFETYSRRSALAAGTALMPRSCRSHWGTERAVLDASRHTSSLVASHLTSTLRCQVGGSTHLSGTQSPYLAFAEDAYRRDPGLTIAGTSQRMSVQLSFALLWPCVRAAVFSTRMSEARR